MNPMGMREGVPDEISSHNTDSLMQLELQRQSDFQILDKNKKIITEMPLYNKVGIKIKIEMKKGSFTYKLQFPLQLSNGYSFALEAQIYLVAIKSLGLL